MDGSSRPGVTVFLPAVLGFVVFVAGHMLLPPAVPSRLPTSTVTPPLANLVPDDGSADPDRAPRNYLRLQQNIASSVPSLGGIVQVQVALAVRTQDHDRVLAAMQERPADVLTPIQETLRTQAERAPDLLALHMSLPPAFRTTVNRRLGTPKHPDPVLEVLITSLLLSQ